MPTITYQGLNQSLYDRIEGCVQYAALCVRGMDTIIIYYFHSVNMDFSAHPFFSPFLTVANMFYPNGFVST